MRAIDPHITEVVVPVEPYEFPLKEIYEKTNGTIEGLRGRGSPEIEDGDGDEDEEVTKKPMMMGKETDGPKILTEDDEGAPRLLHYSEGIASDGVIYVNVFEMRSS